MSQLRKSPTVNLNTDTLIKKLVGKYDESTQDLIHAIAANEARIMDDCQTLADYEESMKAFIKGWAA